MLASQTILNIEEQCNSSKQKQQKIIYTCPENLWYSKECLNVNNIRLSTTKKVSSDDQDQQQY